MTLTAEQVQDWAEDSLRHYSAMMAGYSPYGEEITFTDENGALHAYSYNDQGEIRERFRVQISVIRKVVR